MTTEPKVTLAGTLKGHTPTSTSDSPANRGSANPAVEGAKFVAFGEAGQSAAVNRATFAVSKNVDALYESSRRLIGIKTIYQIVTSGDTPPAEGAGTAKIITDDGTYYLALPTNEGPFAPYKAYIVDSNNVIYRSSDGTPMKDTEFLWHSVDSYESTEGWVEFEDDTFVILTASVNSGTPGSNYVELTGVTSDEVAKVYPGHIVTLTGSSSPNNGTYIVDAVDPDNYRLYFRVKMVSGSPTYGFQLDTTASAWSGSPTVSVEEGQYLFGRDVALELPGTAIDSGALIGGGGLGHTSPFYLVMYKLVPADEVGNVGHTLPTYQDYGGLEIPYFMADISLDSAYDGMGALGSGRDITADSGPVRVQKVFGLSDSKNSGTLLEVNGYASSPANLLSSGALAVTVADDNYFADSSTGDESRLAGFYTALRSEVSVVRVSDQSSAVPVQKSVLLTDLGSAYGEQLPVLYRSNCPFLIKLTATSDEGVSFSIVLEARPIWDDADYVEDAVAFELHNDSALVNIGTVFSSYLTFTGDGAGTGTYTPDHFEITSGTLTIDWIRVPVVQINASAERSLVQIVDTVPFDRSATGGALLEIIPRRFTNESAVTDGTTTVLRVSDGSNNYVTLDVETDPSNTDVNLKLGALDIEQHSASGDITTKLITQSNTALLVNNAGRVTTRKEVSIPLLTMNAHTHWTSSGGTGWSGALGQSETLWIPLQVDVGSVITGVKTRVNIPTGGDDIACTVARYYAGGVDTSRTFTLAGIVDTSTTNNNTITDGPVAAGDSWYMVFAIDGSNSGNVFVEHLSLLIDAE